MLRSALLAGMLAATTGDVAVLPQLRNYGGSYVPSVGAVLVNTDGAAIDADHPLATLALPVQETLQLASANVAAAPGSAFGGSYIFSQTCSGYGTTALEVRGPDGAAWQTIVTASQSDMSGGQMVQLGSQSVVRVELQSTSGCNATLSRVPA